MTLPSTGADHQVDPLNIPKRIILMDLNVALFENFAEMKHHSFINFITSEEKYILPTHGAGANYLAIESNAATRSMYKKLGIKAIDCMREGSWSEIPNE